MPDEARKSEMIVITNVNNKWDGEIRKWVHEGMTAIMYKAKEREIDTETNWSNDKRGEGKKNGCIKGSKQ